MQNYFAGLLVDQLKQRPEGNSLKSALQLVLANLQGLYQHNQLIFQASFTAWLSLQSCAGLFKVLKGCLYSCERSQLSLLVPQKLAAWMASTGACMRVALLYA